MEITSLVSVVLTILTFSCAAYCTYTFIKRHNELYKENERLRRELRDEEFSFNVFKEAHEWFAARQSALYDEAYAKGYEDCKREHEEDNSNANKCHCGGSCHCGEDHDGDVSGTIHFSNVTEEELPPEVLKVIETLKATVGNGVIRISKLDISDPGTTEEVKGTTSGKTKPTASKEEPAAAKPDAKKASTKKPSTKKTK